MEALVWGRFPLFIFPAETRDTVMLTECLGLGFGFSFGVFQDYYSSHLPFEGSGSIAVVGTTTLVSFSFYLSPSLSTFCQATIRTSN